MTRYIKREDFEGIEIDSKGGIFRFACCDCGLVHNMGIALEENGKIGLAFQRDNRATAQLRRYKHTDLQQGKINRYSLVENGR